MLSFLFSMFVTIAVGMLGFVCLGIFCIGIMTILFKIGR